MSRARLAVAVVAMAGTASWLWACSVPVFRYALERWPADPYRIVVFHRGELSAEHAELVATLEARSESEMGMPPLVVESLDVKGEMPEAAMPLWETQKDEPLPRAVVMLPAVYRMDDPIWAGGLSAGTLKQLLDAPAQRQVAERLIGGDSAVWVFLPSGNAEKDAKARETLEASFKVAHEELRLPHELDPMDAEYDMGLSEGVTLALRFSLLELGGDDEHNGFFTSLLNTFEPALSERTDPAVVPVFGRGRALVALIGEEIQQDTILEVCMFLAGPCSCQVKYQNPGMDLLVPVDWDGLVTGMIGMDEALPELSVPVPVAAVAATAAGGESPDAETSPGDLEPTGPAGSQPDADTPVKRMDSWSLARSILVVGAVALLVVAGVTWFMVRPGSASR